jgi:hypothetical protein
MSLKWERNPNEGAVTTGEVAKYLVDGAPDYYDGAVESLQAEVSRLTFRRGAIVNGRTLMDRIEAYPFESEGGDLRMCSDWHELRRCFEHLADYVSPHPAPSVPKDDQIATPQPAHATQAEVTGERKDFDDWWDKEKPNTTDAYSLSWYSWQARAILALRPERVPMTNEQWDDVLGSAGPDMLDLAKQWADNKIHVYQVVNEAEKIVKAAVLRGIAAQEKDGT